MNRIKTMIAAFLAAMMLLGMPAPSIRAEEEIVCSIESISKHGNVHTDLPIEKLNGFGVEVGDTVNIAIGDLHLEDIPCCYNYQNVANKKTLILEDEGYVVLAVNNGDFATTYGIAEKSAEDGNVYENISEEKIRISLCQKGAFQFYNLTYSKKREDYPDSSDEEFGNFRPLKGGSLIEGTLYRGCAPIDDQRGRAAVSEELVREHGIKSIVNLIASKEEVEAMDGFKDSIYSQIDVLYVPLTGNIEDESYIEAMRKIVPYIAEHDGPYYIHCLEGKDRSGFIAAMLEAYAGASYEEIQEDYMQSFTNYYGLKKDDDAYREIAGNFKDAMEHLLKEEDIESKDLRKLMKKLLKESGIDEASLKKMEEKIMTVQGMTTKEIATGLLMFAAVIASIIILVRKKRNEKGTRNS